MKVLLFTAVMVALLLPTGADGQEYLANLDEGDLVFDVQVPRAPDDTDAEAYVKAVLHGRVLGYGQVLQRLEGVAISGRGTASERRLKDFGTFGEGQSDIALPGIVLSRIEPERLRDGSRRYRLEYRVPLTGDGSVLNVVWDEVRKEARANPRPGVNAEGSPEKDYTGLAVDLKGYDVVPLPVTAVVTEDGREVYGAIKPSTEYVGRYGMVGYGRTLDAPPSIRERIGQEPLVVKAIAYRGGEAVVSEADAKAIAAADQKAGFLAEARVAFLVGEE